MSETIRVAVVDDHPLMREGVIHLLNSNTRFDVVGEGNSRDEAVKIAGESKPDIILLDISMPGGGIPAAREIAEQFEDVKIVMLTVSESEANVERALETGARGYILKGVGGDELIRSLEAIHSGQLYVSPELAGVLLNPGDRHHFSSLSNREQQIFSLIPRGLSNKEIGMRVGLSDKTVKYYLTSIFQKLGVRNRVEAAVLARGANDAE